MRLRKVLLQVFYYYQLFAVTVTLILCISSLNYLFNSSLPWHLGLESYNKAKAAEGFILTVFLLYQLIGLFAIIVFKRRQIKMARVKFVLLAGLFTAFFILPSLLFWVSGLSMFSNT